MTIDGLFSTTQSTHPPPVEPRSQLDVSSFDNLTKSLREHPELSKEGDKILNSFQLSKLVDGVRRFQEEHLGRKNQSKYWPLVRIPDPLFHTRSISGPLFTAILSAFRVKQSSPWRNFNFDNPKLYDDNVALLKRMERDLINAGYLKRPRIYFDKTVESGCGAEEARRLARIAERFGASVTEDESEVAAGKVTHLVVYDPEEHDGKDVLEEEEREEESADQDREKKYLRTLGVFDVPLEGDAGNVQTCRMALASIRFSFLSSRMALVHWWYFPASYDEWMDADDVSGEVESIPLSGPGGAAVVGCKFVRDVEKFNEWGVESDYAVMDFERKIAYPLNQPNLPAVTVGKNSNKKRGRLDNPVDADSFLSSISMESEPTKKTKRGSLRSTDAIAAHNTTNISGQPLAPPALSSKACPSSRLTSDRRSLRGTDVMNPRRIQTGLYGIRGEPIRRTVYDGALRIDGDAYRIVRNALADFVTGNEHHIRANALNLSARPEWRKFLPRNAFTRPLLDTSFGNCLVVTELTASDNAEDGTISTNRTIENAPCSESSAS
ncbi:hypothetical protein ACHAWX_007062 [Stephanocyclus meneghinianus]